MKCENIDTTVAVCPGGSGLIDGSLEGRLTDNSFDNPVLIFAVLREVKMSRLTYSLEVEEFAWEMQSLVLSNHHVRRAKKSDNSDSASRVNLKEHETRLTRPISYRVPLAPPSISKLITACSFAFAARDSCISTG